MAERRKSKGKNSRRWQLEGNDKGQVARITMEYVIVFINKCEHVCVIPVDGQWLPRHFR